MRHGLGIGPLAFVAGPAGPTTGAAASFGCAARVTLRTVVLGRTVLTARFGFAATVRGRFGAAPAVFFAAAFFTGGCLRTVLTVFFGALFFAAGVGRTASTGPLGFVKTARGRSRRAGRLAVAGRFLAALEAF